MACPFCIDLDGFSYFPTYGLAPRHHTPEGLVVDHTAKVPGFTSDHAESTHGTWWCPACEEGKPSLLTEDALCPS